MYLYLIFFEHFLGSRLVEMVNAILDSISSPGHIGDRVYIDSDYLIDSAHLVIVNPYGFMVSEND